MTREDNDLLTRVEKGAPMGRMLRQHYWVPAVLSSRLEADGAPVRVRLFGDNFVAFRATDGRVALLDEACPHRGASLALARNANCALQCVFHGWKISVSGELLEMPNEPHKPRELAKRVKVRHYRAIEGAGLVWAWLGEGEAPPPPDFEWMNLPATHAVSCGAELPCNWLQGVEATIDSSHIPLLHASWAAATSTDFGKTTANTAVRYEHDETPYGYRLAALRDLADGRCLARVTEYIAPYYALIAPIDQGANQDRIVIIAVPIDDENLIQWYIYYNPTRPLDSILRTRRANTWPMCGGIPGGPESTWGQDRNAMKHGNSTGFYDIPVEDFVVAVSMGPIVDRTKEFLCSADQGVVRVRRLLLASLQAFLKGETPKTAKTESMHYRDIRSVGGTLPNTDADWRVLPK